jgi:hypothetical protein
VVPLEKTSELADAAVMSVTTVTRTRKNARIFFMLFISFLFSNNAPIDKIIITTWQALSRKLFFRHNGADPEKSLFRFAFTDRFCYIIIDTGNCLQFGYERA